MRDANTVSVSQRERRSREHSEHSAFFTHVFVASGTPRAPEQEKGGADRQREALSVALGLGYYDTPRETTTEDVAREMGCGTSTAAEHLRKAEAALVRSLFEG